MNATYRDKEYIEITIEKKMTEMVIEGAKELFQICKKLPLTQSIAAGGAKLCNLRL